MFRTDLIMGMKGVIDAGWVGGAQGVEEAEEVRRGERRSRAWVKKVRCEMRIKKEAENRERESMEERECVEKA